MSDIRDLVKHALDKQPSKFRDVFDELLSQRVVDMVDERKSGMAENIFGEASDEDEDDIDLDDEDLDLDDEEFEDISDEDIEDIDVEDLLDDEDNDEFGSDEDDEESFNEETAEALEEGRSVEDEGRAIKRRIARSNYFAAVADHMKSGRDEKTAKKIVYHYDRAAHHEDKASISKHPAKQWHTAMMNKHYQAAERLL